MISKDSVMVMWIRKQNTSTKIHFIQYDRKRFGISFLFCNTDVINNVSICALLACFTCLYIFCCCSDKGILTPFFSITISHLYILILFLLISVFPQINETVQTVALRTKLNSRLCHEQP